MMGIVKLSTLLPSLAVPALALSALSLGSAAQSSTSGETQDATFEPVEVQPPFAVSRGADEITIPVPHDEKLVYSVDVELGFFEATAGTVTMTSKVEPWKSSLLVASGDGGGEVGFYHIHAKGKHDLYNLDATIETRHFPREWPRTVYKYTHQGSEKRRREIQLGLRGETHRASYRGDTKKNAPKGQRVWKEREYKDAPRETVDMLSAVYLSRRLIESGEKSMSFPLIDKLNLWNMRLERGDKQTIEVGAGKFKCVKLELIPEPAGKGTSKADKAKFEGLFGLRGAIELYVDETTGVPVKIAGDLPAGIFTFQVEVNLKSFKGTPEGFAPTKAAK